MINERRTENATTILSPTEYTQETAFYSSLLKILYNADLSEYDAEEGTKLRKIKKSSRPEVHRFQEKGSENTTGTAA